MFSSSPPQEVHFINSYGTNRITDSTCTNKKMWALRRNYSQFGHNLIPLKTSAYAHVGCVNDLIGKELVRQELAEGDTTGGTMSQRDQAVTIVCDALMPLRCSKQQN